MARPSDVDEVGFSSDTFYFSISNRGSFYGIVDVWPKVFNDVALLELFNKDGLCDATIIGGIGQVFTGKITG